MSLTEIGDFVNSVGLPAATSIGLLWYILTKLNGKIDRMVNAIESLTKIVQTIDDGALQELNDVKDGQHAIAEKQEQTNGLLHEIRGALGR